MSTRTLGQLVTNLRDRLDEATASFWTNPQLEKWLMDGARDIARQAECLQAKATIAVTGATQEYTAPTDMVRIYRAEYKRTGDSQIYPLTFRDYNNMDEIWYSSKTIHQSTPAYYTMWGYPPAVTISLYPTPAVSGSMYIYYYRLPADLATDGSADSSVVDVPVGWEDLIVDYAEYCALRKDNDAQWKDAKGLYEEKLADIVATTQRWTDQEGMIVSDSGVGVTPYWLYGG